MKKTSVFSLILFTVALTMGSVAAAQDVLKIGVPQPLSGGGAPWGVPVDRAVRLAAEDINTAGGIKADGKTYQIKVIRNGWRA